MMNKIQNELALGHCVTWTYKGQNCGIDPFWSINDDTYHYDMWYGDDLTGFSDTNGLLTAAFFDGKTIIEILSDVVDLDVE